jgi:hypothetical protein
MRRLAPVVCAAALAAAVAADDKVGKTAAPALLARIVPEIRKIDGYAFDYAGSVGQYNLDSSGFSYKNGVVKQTTGAGALVYRKGTAAFAKDKDGKWAGASSQGPELQALVASPTPDGLLGEALDLSKRAKYGQDEDVGGVTCKMIECDAPAAKIKAYMENMAKYFRPEAAGMVKMLQIDEKESYMIYRIYVSKDDLVIRRVVRDTKIEFPESVMKQYPMLEAAKGQTDQVLTVDLKKHGEPLEEIPADVKKLLQVK